MLKINKIEDKQEVIVLSQKNCDVVGYTERYQGPNDDCRDDCYKIGKPKHYGSYYY
ncbi:hypothetical protein [Metaclostridioides mangenotii]|uniref:hypothetical protein n=1 Tax=Metaclostridioides mangenotii TaxID=1540 RepID=UPI0004B45719|nr:hypothetical protein [Clostridioides mangenotii]